MVKSSGGKAGFLGTGGQSVGGGAAGGFSYTVSGSGKVASIPRGGGGGGVYIPQEDKAKEQAELARKEAEKAKLDAEKRAKTEAGKRLLEEAKARQQKREAAARREQSRAQERLSREIEANILRQKKRGSTQAERDLQRSQAFYDKQPQEQPVQKAKEYVDLKFMQEDSVKLTPKTFITGEWFERKFVYPKVQSLREKEGQEPYKSYEDYSIEVGKQTASTKGKVLYDSPFKYVRKVTDVAGKYTEKLSSAITKQKLTPAEKKLASTTASDIYSLAFLTPATLSTTDTYNMLSEQGLKPTKQTQFKAVVKQKGEVSDIAIAERTTIGDVKKIYSLSRQTATQTSDDVSKVMGKSLRFSKEGSKIDITASNVFGGSRTGQAQKVLSFGDDVLKISDDLGKGYTSKSVSQDYMGFTLKKTNLKQKAFLDMDTSFVKQKFTGVVKEIPDTTIEAYKYAGSSTPRLKLTKTGFKSVIDDIDIRGTIYFPKTKTTDASVVKTSLTSIQKQKVIQDIIGKVGVTRTTTPTMKNIIKTPFILPTGSRTKAQTIQKARTTEVQLTNTLDKQSTKSFQISYSSLASAMILKPMQKQKSILRQINTSSQQSRQQSKLKQGLKQAQLSKAIQRQTTRTTFKFSPFLPSVNTKTPGTILPIFPFKLPKGTLAKSKKRKIRYKDELFYTPSFTARALGIKSKLTSKQLKDLTKTGISLRPIPI